MLKHFLNNFFFHNIFERILRRPWAVLIIIVSVTLFFLWHIPQLSFKTSVYDLLIEDLPENTRYENFKAIFGSDEIIRVVIKSKNIFDPVIFKKIEQLSETASKIKGVRRIISLPDIRKAVDIKSKWSMKEFAAVLSEVDLFRKNLFSLDHTSTALTLVLSDKASHEDVIRDVEKMIDGASTDLSLYQIGMPLVSQALARLTKKDFLRLPPITFFLIALVLFFLYRKVIYIALPLACVTIATIWTFGIMALTSIPLSMLTMIVPVFLIAVGTAYCLHIISEYFFRVQYADTPKNAVLATFSTITFPTVLATLTTIIGLGSLLINRITSIREFAVFSCLGIFSLMIILLTFLPAALALIPVSKKKDKELRETNKFFDRFLSWIIRLDLDYQKITLPIFGIIVIICLAGIFRIRVETNPVGYFKENIPVSRNFHDIYKHLSGSFPINVTMGTEQEDYFEDPKHVADIARFQKFLETLSCIDKTISFADYIKLVNYASNRFEPKYYTLPKKPFEVRILINNYKSMLGEDMFSRFMNPDFSKTNILLLTHISSSSDFLKTRKTIVDHVQQSFAKDLLWNVTGFGMVISESSHLLTSGQVKSLSITLALIFCIMLLLFLSSKVGLIAIIPNCFPIIINFGLMGWLGINLSVATSLIACIAIGLAVDDTIHYLTRYSREIKKDLDKDRALHDTIKSVGKPIIFTTLTISVGFSILIFSHFKPTSVFGLMMVITMFSALVGDLILLPSLMLHVELVTAWDLLKLMPTTGGISPGITHELNQPLNAIKMGSEFLKMIIQQKEKIREELMSQVIDEISAQVDKASGIINRLGTFGLKSDFKKKEVNINESIRETLAIIGHQLKVENIQTELELVEGLPPILGHKNRLRQVVFNLVINAYDAISTKQKIEGDFNATHVIRIRTFQKNDRVAVTVSDTGIGILSNQKVRIFEPFFTTKETGKGKGLGLTISNEIVRDYGGRIDVESEAGQGATFKMTFPACVTL